MRFQPAQLQQFRAKPKAAPISITAPVGGWNTVSALADMPEQDAILLDNYYPSLGKVTVRKGFASHATGVGAAAVETLKEYNVGSTRKLLAASSSTIYDATASGAASSIQAGFTSGRWQVADFIANQFWCNGVDTPQLYDGSTFTASTINGTGLTATAIVGCHAHQHHLFVWMSNSQSFWYGGVDDIGGTFTEFPLGRVATIGGNLIAMGTWSTIQGNQSQDMAVFIMSSGEAIAYSGTDPGSATDWAIVDIFRLGAPLGPRALTKEGSDLKVITVQDFVSLGSAETAGNEQDMPNIPPTKVQAAIIQSASAAQSSFGWQAIVYPRGGFTLLNVPQADGSFHQYLQNHVTQAWCRYTGIEASCWSKYNDNLYFGGAGGIVYQAETGNDDDGDVIQADVQTAWTTMQIPQRKRVAAIRPLLGVTGDLTYNFGIGFDFQSPTVTDPSTITGSGSPWDTSPWDITPWSPENVVSTGWRIASGTGNFISLRLRINGMSEVNWYSSDLRIEPGNAL